VSRAAILIMFLALQSLFTVAGRATTSATIQVEPFGAPVGQTPLISARNGRVYLFDDRTNRLFICDGSGKVLKTTGSIGDGPGQFYKPSAMVTGAHSVVIYDRGNNRIVVLTLDGDVKSQFPVQTQLYNIAAGDDDTIYVNDPSSGHLITALDINGRVLRSFGNLSSLSALHHTNNQTRDTRFHLTANRVRLAIDKSDHIFAVFMIAPVIREYSHDGALIKEVSFDNANAHQLQELFWHKDPNLPITSGIIDGNQVPFLVKDVSVNPATGEFVVLTALSKLLIFDAECKEISVLEIKGVLDSQLWKMAVEDRSIWLVRVFLPGTFHGEIPGPQSLPRLAAKKTIEKR
jgi:6-bladed beta-propeller